MAFDFLWTFQEAWKIKLVVLMLFGQMGLTVWLYTQMSNARIAARKAGQIKPEDYSVVGQEPEGLAIYTRTLANQFEAPVMFYAVVITGLAIGVTSWITVLLAFLFVLSRIVHAREMLGNNEVLKRRKMFINSMRILLLLMVELLISTVFFLEV